MVRYFYAWTPLVIVVGTTVVLTIPYLALIALMIVALAVPAGLVWAIVSVFQMLGRAIGRRGHEQSEASSRTVAALSPAHAGIRRTRSAPAGASALLARPAPGTRPHITSTVATTDGTGANR
jgi:hypothetical protein